MKSAFTLVEMLVVIAIISILMTAGVVGLNGMGGKGVTSGVVAAESVFDEARTTAISRNIRSCVLVAKELTNAPNEDLRRMLVAYEDTNDNGTASDPNSSSPTWVLSSRAVLLPDQTYFSQKFSRRNNETGGELDSINSGRIQGVKSSHAGEYFIYEFNSQGICKTQGATFIIGTGIRKINASGIEAPPKVSGSAKKDFGGFVIWRNGSTSIFRSPDQMGDLKNINPGDTF